ncbi:MAG: helicase-associated domain-containing protein [Isosphaeraceae bacterium]
MSEAEPKTAGGSEGQAPASTPLDAYRSALVRYDVPRLTTLARRLGGDGTSNSARILATLVTDRLGDSRQVSSLSAPLPHSSKLALSMFAVTEATTWPIEGLDHALRVLGSDPTEAVAALIEAGLVAAELDEGTIRTDLAPRLEAEDRRGITLRVHPTVVSAGRTVLPEPLEHPLPEAGSVRQERESDGLEPLIRMAVVWQRVEESPLRQTQQGTFYKRDRERLEDDPAVAGPITDAIEPLPDMPALWLSLSKGIGLLKTDADSERISAAGPEFWTDNGYHLGHMVAAEWLRLWTWHEQGGIQSDNAEVRLALPFVRIAVLLWLATLPPDSWAALDDLAAVLRARSPRWDRPAFQGDVILNTPEPATRARPGGRGRGKSRGKDEAADEASRGIAALEAMLLGAAYQLGLIRAGEEIPSGRRVVRLTPLGRYLLALGPPPPPREGFEHFLYVQPSFEIIAYRQGLTAALIGRFSRFAAWTQVGAALALKLTPESVYRGLEGGMTPQGMIDQLQRHSPRPLPSSVIEAIRSWAGRRERVAYHASATLIEFASKAERDEAVRTWPESDLPAPVKVSDRLLLVEDERAIPFQRFRLSASRDYRRPPEVCVEVEVDGVTLVLDPSRSDLLVDAEIARFADERPAPAHGNSGTLRRRFEVSMESLARGFEAGLTESALGTWFERRSGAGIPPAVRLLLLASNPPMPPVQASRPIVLRTASAEILDGLMQHPLTRNLMGERLGPTAVVVADESMAALRRAAERISIPFAAEGISAIGYRVPFPRFFRSGWVRNSRGRVDRPGRRPKIREGWPQRLAEPVSSGSGLFAPRHLLPPRGALLGAGVSVRTSDVDDSREGPESMERSGSALPRSKGSGSSELSSLRSTVLVPAG